MFKRSELEQSRNVGGIGLGKSTEMVRIKRVAHLENKDDLKLVELLNLEPCRTTNGAMMGDVGIGLAECWSTSSLGSVKQRNIAAV